MGYFLLAPETVIFWAARQHFAARDFAKKHREKHIGWTMAHSFFLIMGGFTLHEGGKPVRVLEAKELEELSEAGKIEWPTITKEEIDDRSKGDLLSKTIVLFQTIWFMIQWIARLRYRLTVTHLEVVTFSFSIFTGIIYYLWLHKPLDVRCSIPVHFLEVSDQETQIQIDISTPHSTLTNTGHHTVIPAEISDETTPVDDAVIHSNPLSPTPVQDDRSTLFELGYKFIVFPLKRFFIGVGDMFHCNTLGDHSLGVPTFYSSPNKPSDIRLVGTLAIVVTAVFAAIHCYGIFLYFVTSQEASAWLLSTASCILPPVILFTIGISNRVFEMAKASFSGVGPSSGFAFLTLACTCLYFIGRIAIFVLSFMELRSLPEDAYRQVKWVSFFPHI